MINIKKVLLVFSLTLLFLKANPSGREFRASWVITWEYIGPSQSSAEIMTRIDEIMDNHAAANMTAVLFQVRQSGTAYYESSYEPWGYYAGYENPGIDPLEYAVNAAHDRGLELHAWFNVFQTSSMSEGTPAEVHPEWICRDQDGDPMTSHRSVSPGLEDVRQYTVNVAMEIVNNYDIDGLHLDYVRWNEYSSSSQNILPPGQIEEIRMIDGIISDETLYDLENSRIGRYLYDVDHPYSSGIPDDYSSWEDWWRDGVTAFVSTLHDSIQMVKPFVRLSSAVLGRYNWGGWQGYGTVYQDAALWMNNGYVDHLTPMHYHWTSPNSFVQMLTGSNQSWAPYIQGGIQAGRLFSAGPGSYILADQNLWDNHPAIVDAVRNIDFVDGFQFFSNGTWEDYQYWEEAGHTFFEDKAIVRNITYYETTTDLPPDPNITLTQINDLEYLIDIETNSAESSAWTVVSLNPSDSSDISNSIHSIHFGSEDIMVPLTFDGLQPYEGAYHVHVQNFNRFWVGSETSAQETTGEIPSYPPTLTDINLNTGDTAAVNTMIRIEFSKEMDPTSFASAFSLNPEPDTLAIDWSDYWEDEGRVVFISFPDLLEFDMDYSLEISAELTDIIGIHFDGNMDGVGGDGFSITFHTESTDLTGPQVTEFYPPTEFIFDTDGVFNITWDEMVDPGSINQMSIQFQSNGQYLTTDHIENTIDEITTVSLKPFAPLLNDASCTVILNGITDTLGNAIASALEYSYNTVPLYYSSKTYMDRFNSGAGWWQPDGSGSTTGILGSETQFGYNSSVFVPGVSMNSNGRKSGSLRYGWDPDASSSFLRLHNAGDPSDIALDTSNVLQVYVYSDGSGNQFSISLYEYLNGSLTEDIIEVLAWEELNWMGWKLIEWDLSDPEQVGTWLSGDQTMDGDEYFLDGFLMKPGQDSDMSGRVYFDDLRIVTKAEGDPPMNSAPVITALPDITIENGDNFYFYVEFSDNNENDIHQITATTDTSSVIATIYGHTPGSVVNIEYEPFIGETNIIVTVNDFGLGELADTVQFLLTIQGDLFLDEKPIPDKFSLGHAYPNPFNPVITIPFTIERLRNISILIFDIGGHLVKTLTQNETISPGNYQRVWNGTNNLGQTISSGTYFIQISSNHNIFHQKITYIK
mgnify:FL=1